MKGIALAGPIAVVAVLATAPAAWSMTTISRSGNTITISGGDEANVIEQLSPGGEAGPLRYRDTSGISFSGSCTDVGGNTVECGNLGPGLVANVSLGGGDDIFQPDATLLTSTRLVVDLGAGNDTMWGSPLADTIQGGDGNDEINGRAGADAIDGGAGNDRLTGSSGDDTITGGAGVDSLFGDGDFTQLGNYGNDTLQARDGEIDALSCSFGADTAVADANDTFDALGDCETADLGGGGGGGGGGDTATTLTVGAKVAAGVKLATLLAGKALSFTFSVSDACKGTARVIVLKREAKRLKIGTKDTVIAADSATVPAGGSYRASVKLKSAYRKKLKRAKSIKAQLVIVCTTAGGAQGRAARNFVLKR